MSKDPNDDLFFPRLRKHTRITFIVVGALFLIIPVAVALVRAL